MIFSINRFLKYTFISLSEPHDAYKKSAHPTYIFALLILLPVETRFLCNLLFASINHQKKQKENYIMYA